MARNGKKKKKPAAKKSEACKKGDDLALDEFSRLCDEAVAQAPKDNAANASSSKAANVIPNPFPKAPLRKSHFKNLAQLRQWKLDQKAQEEESNMQQQRMITYTDVDGRKYTMPAPSPDSDESSQPEERSYDQAHTGIASSCTIQCCTTFTDLKDRTAGIQTLENGLQIVIPNKDPHDEIVEARPARNDEFVTLMSLSEEADEGNMAFGGVLPGLGFNSDDRAKGVGAEGGHGGESHYHRRVAASSLETAPAAESSDNLAQDNSDSARAARARAWEQRWRSLQALAKAAQTLEDEERYKRADLKGSDSSSEDLAEHSANINGPQAFIAETKAEVQREKDRMIVSLWQELGGHAPPNDTSSTATTPAPANHEAKPLKAHDTDDFNARYASDARAASPSCVPDQVNDHSSIDDDDDDGDSELSSCDCELCKFEAPSCCQALNSLLDKGPTQVQPLAPANPRAPRPTFAASTWAGFDALMIEANLGCDVQWFEWVMAFRTPYEAPFEVYDCDDADFLMFGPRYEREERYTEDEEEEEEEQEEDEAVEAGPSSLASGRMMGNYPVVRDEGVAMFSPSHPMMEDVAPLDPPQPVSEKPDEQDADDPIPPDPPKAEEEEEPGPSNLAPPETAQAKKKKKKKKRHARTGPQAGSSQTGPSQAGSSQEQEKKYVDTLIELKPESAEKKDISSALDSPEPAQEAEQDTDTGLTPEAFLAEEDQTEGPPTPSAPSPAEEVSNKFTPLKPAQKTEELPGSTAAGIFVDSVLGESFSDVDCFADLDLEPETPYDELQEEIEVWKSGGLKHDELKNKPSRQPTPNGVLTPASAINGGTSSKHQATHVKIKSVGRLSQENQKSASETKTPPSVRSQRKMLVEVPKVTGSKPSTLISTASAASTTTSLNLEESALAQNGLTTVDESSEQMKARTTEDKMPEQMQPYYTNGPLVEEPEPLPLHGIDKAPISEPETSQLQSGNQPVSMALKEEQFEPTTAAVLEDFKRPTYSTTSCKVEEWLQGREVVVDVASAMTFPAEAPQSGFSTGSDEKCDEVDCSNVAVLNFGRVESPDQPEKEIQAWIPGGKKVASTNQAAVPLMAEREEVRQRVNPPPPPPRHYRLEDFDYAKLVSDLMDQPVAPSVAKRKGRAMSGDGDMLLVREWRSMGRRWQTISWNDEL